MNAKATFFLLLGFLSVGCNNDSLPYKSEEINFHLKDTYWKLVGYVDMADGKLTEAEPTNNEQYFTLVFESDSVGVGKTVYHTFDVHLSSEPIVKLRFMTYVFEGGNVDLFYEAIKTVDRYNVDKEGLKFYYNTKKNYLLYKQMVAHEVN